MSAIYTDEISAFAASAIGEEESEELIKRLCSAAAAELEAKLRDGVKVEDIKEQFVTAAGVLALSMYTALGGAKTPRSFRAGQLSVEFGGKNANADSLRRAAESMLAGYLTGRGFAFLGV